MTFFVEIGERRSAYCENFEQVLLADTASYYSQLASEWLFRDSFSDYMLKVKSKCVNSLTMWLIIHDAEDIIILFKMLQVNLCLNQENTRLGQYLSQTTINKLLQVLYHYSFPYHHQIVVCDWAYSNFHFRCQTTKVM